MTGKQVGQIIEKRRRALRMSRAQLAKVAGLSRSTIYRLETRGAGTLESYLAIRKALWVSGAVIRQELWG